jgi:hypothetical protein
MFKANAHSSTPAGLNGVMHRLQHFKPGAPVSEKAKVACAVLRITAHSGAVPAAAHIDTHRQRRWLVQLCM